jgi:hypothetical protein
MELGRLSRIKRLLFDAGLSNGERNTCEIPTLDFDEVPSDNGWVGLSATPTAHLQAPPSSQNTGNTGLNAQEIMFRYPPHPANMGPAGRCRAPLQNPKLPVHVCALVFECILLYDGFSHAPSTRRPEKQTVAA